MLSQFYVVYDVADANMPDPQNMFLRLKARNLGNGNSYSSSVPIAGATDMKAGAMTATHVQTIMALQAAVSQLRSSVTSLQTASSQHGNQLFIIQAAGYVVTGIAQGNPHSSRVNLRITQHDVRTGEDFVFDGSTYLTGATNEKAGVMTAQQCNALNVAKTDITALQSAMRKVQGAGCVVDGATVFHIATDRIGIMLFGYNLATGEREVELQQLYLSAASEYGAGVMTARQVKRLNELYQAVFGSSNNATSFFNFGIEIGEGKRELFLKHAVKLVELGYVPYLFRYSRKRNRKIDNEGIKGHGDLRKGWNVVGKGETIQIGNNGQVSINKIVFEHEEYNDEQMQSMAQFQSEAKFFVADKYDEAMGIRYVPFGKNRINLHVKINNEYQLRKVRLQYGIAFASYRAGKRELLDKTRLVTPIVPFHIANVPFRNGGYRWVFER